MDRVKLKEFSKKRLNENRWPMIVAALAVALSTGLVSACTSSTYDESGEVTMNSPVLAILALVLTVFVVNIIKIGACKFFRDNINVNQEVSVIGYPFKNNYTKNVLTMFLQSVFLAIGLILLIVPGLILSFGFAAVPYLLVQKPELSAMDTLKLSWEVMKGHKWEYCVLLLSFIGWFILDALTLGILGVFYVHPYMMQTEARYFDILLENV